MLATYRARTISLLLSLLISMNGSFAMIGPHTEDAWRAQYSAAMTALKNRQYKDAERSLLACLSSSRGNRANFLLALAALEDLYDTVQNHAGEEQILLTYLGLLHASGENKSIRVAGVYLRLGGLNALMDRYAKSEEHFEVACEILAELFGPASIDLGIAVNNVAWAERKQMKTADAEKHYLESLGILASTAGQDSALYGLTAISLAELYASMKNKAEAVFWYEKAIDSLKNSVAADHPAVLSATRRLASLKRDLAPRK